jgi:hypothetical protein
MDRFENMANDMIWYGDEAVTRTAQGVPLAHGIVQTSPVVISAPVVKFTQSTETVGLTPVAEDAKFWTTVVIEAFDGMVVVPPESGVTA